MKISEFSNKSNVSEQTIRFYIKKGLLIPLHTSYQYSFSEQDLKDLRYIQSCKRMGFSLEETLRILSLHRVASLHGPKEVSYLLNILQRKRNELEKAQEALKDSIQELSRSIEEYQLKISNPVRTSGMPLSFLDLLECPDCHGAFTLSDAVIRNGQVLSGRLSCGCGAVFTIQDGILYDKDLPSILDNSFFNAHTTFLEEYDAQTVTAIKKDEQALLALIPQKLMAEPKVIIETNFKRWFFTAQNIESIGMQHRYIFAESYPEVVAYHKSIFDSGDDRRQCLFMACRPNRYPLRHGCVDLWIDYMDSTDFSESNCEFLPAVLRAYMKQEAHIYGVSLVIKDPVYFEKLKQLHPELPDNLYKLYAPGGFEENLKKAGYQIKDTIFLRNIWETSAQSGISVSKNPPYRMLYSARIK